MEYRWYRRDEALLREIRGTQLTYGMLAFWYVGQMGVIVKYGEDIICFDTILNQLADAEGVMRTNYEPAFAPERFTGVTAMICSHDHADHINPKTLIPAQHANPEMKIVMPQAVKADVCAKGVSGEGVIGARAGMPIRIGENITIHPIASAHEAYDRDENGDYRAMGYIVEAGPFRLYHSGDTVLTEQLISDVQEACAECHQAGDGITGLDVAFLPINGVDLERHRRDIIGNMDSRSAAFLAEQIDADMVIPMHYDWVPGNLENPLYFADVMRNLYPGRKYHILQLGERMLLAKTPGGSDR